MSHVMKQKIIYFATSFDYKFVSLFIFWMLSYFVQFNFARTKQKFLKICVSLQPDIKEMYFYFFYFSVTLPSHYNSNSELQEIFPIPKFHLNPHITAVIHCAWCVDVVFLVLLRIYYSILSRHIHYMGMANQQCNEPYITSIRS